MNNNNSSKATSQRKGPRRILVAAAVILIVAGIHMAREFSSIRKDSAVRSSQLKPPPRLTPAAVRKKLLNMGLQPLLQENESDPWKAEHFARIDKIRVSCGKLCQINSLAALEEYKVAVPGAPFPMVRVPEVNCPAIVDEEGIDAGDTTIPPIPSELQSFFTLDGAYQVVDKPLRKDIYFNTTVGTVHWPTGHVWEEADINKAVRQVGQGSLAGTYGAHATKIVRDKLSRVKVSIKNKRILVIGSSHPWIEAILLYHGAAHVTTLEFGIINSKHPKLQVVSPKQFRDLYFSGELGEFDGVVSHSSLEHTGLGRYGDALNPWGDILSVAEAWCVTKDRGFLYLAVPTGKDLIYSNWHRVYGRVRWPLVTANWKCVDRTDGSELDRKWFDSLSLGGQGYLFEKVSNS